MMMFHKTSLAAVLCTSLLLVCMGEDRARAPIRISWSEGPEYPMGIQDSAFAVLNGKAISAGGFTRHPKDVLKTWPDAFQGQKSGFTSFTFLFDPNHPELGWSRITDLPGPSRQAAITVVVNDALYAIGGFSYTPPYTYRSTYRIANENGRWVWADVHADLPWPLCEAAAGVIGNKIYIIGGADFFRWSANAKGPEFSSTKGRNGDPVGTSLLVLDTQNLKSGWQKLAKLPGVSRFDNAGGALGEKIYALGGVYRDGTDRASSYSNVVDSWVYDITSERWSRLPDQPQGSNRRAVAFRDRYLVLLGGFRYEYTQNLNGTPSGVYSPDEKRLTFQQHFEKTVLVFDSKTNRTAAIDSLLDTTSLPMAAVSDSTIYVLGGEGGSRLFHPATFQIGRAVELAESQ